MSHETRRRVVFALVALLVVAMVLSLVGCTTTSGETAANTPLTVETYPAAMEEICAATAIELDDVPEPPEQISLVDWSAEISRILDNEANRFEDLRVADDLSESHGSLIRTAREQAEQLALLGEAIAEADGDTSGIGAINDEIRSLSLGREALAAELAIPACGTRALA